MMDIKDKSPEVKKQTQHISRLFTVIVFTILCGHSIFAQGTRLLRQPTISATHIAFAYGGDIWITSLGDADAVRLTSTPAVESDPHFSPDGIRHRNYGMGNASHYPLICIP